MVATREIKHREVILAVPLSWCISVERVKYGFRQPHCGKPESTDQLTKLGELIDQEPNLFSREENTDADNLVLTLFLMEQTIKAKGSRWHSFVSILNPIDETTDQVIESQEQ